MRYSTHVVQEGARSAALQQLRMAFVQGCDVFAILPTGYGKISCYGCLLLVFDKLMNTKGDHSSNVVVVTPLTEIMKD